MAVKDIAREEVVSVTPDTPVKEVVRAMRTENVGSVVVLDDGIPLGIVTDRDLVMEVLGADGDPAATTAREVMSGELVTVDADEGLYALTRTMAEKGVRRVPVVEDGTLVGIVSVDDVIILLGMELRNIANLIRSESPPYETPATQLYDE